MTNLQLKNKALEYIEKLCYAYEDSDKTDSKNIQKIMDEIYMFVHCVQEKHSCYNAHEDWRKN